LSRTVWSKKTDPLVYFDDNFGKYGPIKTFFSPLKQEIYEAQKLKANTDAGINANFFWLMHQN